MSNQKSKVYPQNNRTEQDTITTLYENMDVCCIDVWCVWMYPTTDRAG